MNPSEKNLKRAEEIFKEIHRYWRCVEHTHFIRIIAQALDEAEAGAPIQHSFNRIMQDMLTPQWPSEEEAIIMVEQIGNEKIPDKYDDRAAMYFVMGFGSCMKWLRERLGK